MRHQGKLALTAIAAIGFAAHASEAMPIVPLPGSETGAIEDVFQIQTTEPVAIDDNFSAFIIQVVGTTEFKPNAFAGQIAGEFVQQHPDFGFAVFPTPSLEPLFPGDDPTSRTLDSHFLVLPPPLVVVTDPQEPLVEAIDDIMPEDASHRVGIGSVLSGDFALDLREDALTEVWDLARIVVSNDLLGSADTAAAMPIIQFDAAVSGGGRPDVFFNFSFEAPPIPEPTTASMFGMLAAFGLMRRKH